MSRSFLADLTPFLVAPVFALCAGGVLFVGSLAVFRRVVAKVIALALVHLLWAATTILLTLASGHSSWAPLIGLGAGQGIRLAARRAQRLKLRERFTMELHR